jgi:phage gp36-like protein
MYATLADMVARFGEEQLVQLTDRNRSGVVDAVVIDQALTDASAVVDGYLSGRYEIPLTPVPPILVGYTCDLARYNLYPDAELSETNPVRARQRDAIKFLQFVGEGKLSLGIHPEPTSDNSVQFSSAGKVFSREARG